jgi:hypothetical protein
LTPIEEDVVLSEIMMNSSYLNLILKKQKISVSDNVVVLNHRDVLRLFGYKKGHYQREFWKINKFNEMVWFSKLYPN